MALVDRTVPDLLALRGPLPRSIDDAHEEIRYLRDLVGDLYAIDDDSAFIAAVGIGGGGGAILRVLFERYPDFTEHERLRRILALRRELRPKMIQDINEVRILGVTLNRLRVALRKHGVEDGLPHVDQRGPGGAGYRITAECHAWIKGRLACPQST